MLNARFRKICWVTDFTKYNWPKFYFWNSKFRFTKFSIERRIT